MSYCSDLDAVHGNFQQPAHNLITIYTEPFFALHYIIRILTPQPMTSLPLVTMPMPLKTTNSSTSENSWMPVIEYCDLYLSYSVLSTANLQNFQHNYYENLHLRLQKRWRILVQLSGLQCWEWLENMLIAEMRRRGDQALEDSTAMLEIQ